MDSGWLAYTCDSGNVLFFSNKYTNEYRWISCCCPRDNYNNYYTANGSVMLQGAQHLTTDQLLCRGPRVKSVGTDACLPLPPQPTKQMRTQGTQTEVEDKRPCGLTNSNVFCLEDSNGNPVNNITIKTVTKDERRSIYDPPPGTPVIIKVNKRKMYPCSFCDKVLSAYALLVKHMKIYHSIDKPIDEFNGTTDEVAMAPVPPVNHTNMQEAPGQVQCFQCDAILPSKEALNEHCTVHYDELECKKCGKVYGCNKSYRNHLPFHLGVNYKCNCCTKKFVMKVGLLRHIKTMHAAVWNDKLRAELNRIEQISADYKNSQINCLSYNTTTSAHNNNNNSNNKNNVLQEDVDIDTTAQVIFKCDGCGVDYPLFADLTKHQQKCSKVQRDKGFITQKHNSLSSRLFWCSKCKVVLKTKKTFKKHMRSKRHRPEKSTQEKGRGSTSTSTQTGDDKLPVQCPHCQETFQDFGTMHWHKKFSCHKAPNTDNMTCGYCSKVFKNRVQLSRHWATHIPVSKNGEYPCDQCNKSVESLYKLETHLYYHLTLFFCNLCDKRYHAIKELKKHYQREHKKAAFSTAGEIVQQAKEAGKFHTNKQVQEAGKSQMNKQVQETGKFQMNEHAQDSEKSRHYKCGFCGIVFNKTKNQKEHVKRCRKRHRLAASQVSMQQKAQRSESSTSTDDTQEASKAAFTPREHTNNETQVTVDHQPLSGEQKDVTQTGSVLKQEASDTVAPNLRDRSSITNTEPFQLEAFTAVKQTTFSCTDCKKGFPNKFSLVRHQELMKHGEQQKKLLKKKFKCQVCKKSFHLYSVFYHHQLQHNKKDKHTCRLCKTKFVTLQALTLHRCAKAYTETAYQCHMCEASFDTGQGLSNHKRAHLINGKKSDHQCVPCGKIFENAKRLKRHTCSEKLSKKLAVKTIGASNAKQYECGDCGKFLSCKSSLLRHKENVCSSQPRTPSAETAMKFKCHNCSKRFENYPDFADHHNAAHGTGKPCWHCSKDFSSHSNLHRHLRDIHHDTKQFFCLYCSKEFSTITAYSKHVVYAPNEKRHKCPHCNMDFSLCLRLMEHINSVH